MVNRFVLSVCLGLLSTSLAAQDGGDLPSPSILIGLTTGGSVALLPGTLEPDPIAAAYADPAAREAFRREDPVLFADIVESGLFDPEDAALAIVIQTELQRMDCYEMRIDGLFGPGSKEAVRRYYAARDIEAPALPTATVALFRDIILSAPVTCPPVPVVVQEPRPPSGPSGPGPTETEVQTPPAEASDDNQPDFDIIIIGGRG